MPLRTLRSLAPASLGALLLLAACATPPGATAKPPGAGRPDQASADADRTSPLATLRVFGALAREGRFAQDDLEALGAEDVAWTFRNESHTYRALRLDRLLMHLGFDAGPGGQTVAPGNRHPGYRATVVARARDGFSAVFTVAELLPDLGSTAAFVAFRRIDGEMPPDEGPLRILVPTDKAAARAVRMLRELEVVPAPGNP